MGQILINGYRLICAGPVFLREVASQQRDQAERPKIVRTGKVAVGLNRIRQAAAPDRPHRQAASQRWNARVRSGYNAGSSAERGRHTVQEQCALFLAAGASQGVHRDQQKMVLTEVEIESVD